MDLISLATSVHVVGGICWLQSLGFRVNSGHPGSESMPCKDFALLQCCVMSFLLLSPWGPLQPLMSSYNTVLGPGEPPGVVLPAHLPSFHHQLLLLLLPGGQH